VLQGSARLTAGGESWELVPGTLARVGARQKRIIVPGPRESPSSPSVARPARRTSRRRGRSAGTEVADLVGTLVAWP